MSEITRRTTPDRARKIAADLAAVGIKPPADAAAHLARLDDLDARRPTAAEPLDLVAAYADGKPDKALEAMAVRMSVQSELANAWTEGRIKVGRSALHAFTAAGDALTAELAEVAAPLIEQMTRAAAVDTHDVANLIRAGRSTDAELAARVDIVAGDLEALYRLRDRICAGAEWGRGGVDCRRWRDPRPARAANAGRTPPTSATEGFMRGLRAGGVLWFPTPGEAEAAALPILAELKAEAEAAKVENRRHSFATGI